MAKRSDHLIEFNQDVKEFGAGSGPLVCGSTAFPAMLSKLLSAGLKLAAAAAALAALVILAASLYVGFAPLSIETDSARVNIKLYNRRDAAVSYYLVYYNRQDRILRVHPGEDENSVHFTGKNPDKDYDALQILEGEMPEDRMTLEFQNLEPGTGYEALIVARSEDGLRIAGRFPFTTLPEGNVPGTTASTENTPAPPPAVETTPPAPPEPVQPQETEPEETEPEETEPKENIYTPPYIPPYTPPSNPTSSVKATGKINVYDQSDPVENDDGRLYGYTMDIIFTLSEGAQVTPVNMQLERSQYWFWDADEPWNEDGITVDAADISGTQTLTATVVIDPETGVVESGRDEWTATLTYVDSNGQTGTATATTTVALQAHATLNIKSVVMTRLISYNLGDGSPGDTCEIAIDAEAQVIPGINDAPELTVTGLYITLPDGSTNTSSNMIGFSTYNDGELAVTSSGKNKYRISAKRYAMLERNPIDEDPTAYSPYMECYLGEMGERVFDDNMPIIIKHGPGYDPEKNQNGIEDDVPGATTGMNSIATQSPEPDYSSDAVTLPEMPDGCELLDIIQSGVSVNRLETVSPGELIQIRILVSSYTDAADGETVTLTPPTITSGKVVVTQPAPAQVAANNGEVSDTFWYSFHMPADTQVHDLIIIPAD